MHSIRTARKSPFLMDFCGCRPAGTETAAIVVEAQWNGQPIMTGEMEPNALNVTLGLWGAAMCEACRCSCSEATQAERKMEREKERKIRKEDGRESEHSPMCMYVCVSVLSPSVSRPTSISRICACL